MLLLLCQSAALAPYARTHELSARAAGRLAVGLDEAGVGAIAGPIVAAAVLLPDEWQDADAAIAVDSKVLSRSARRLAFERLDRTPELIWAVGIESVGRVDLLGPSAAALSAMQVAARRLERRLLRHSRAPTASCFYLVDGENMPAGLDGRPIVHGDREEAAIAAASIVAAAAHDAALCALARRWPLWELEANAGWPSRVHLQHIAAHGPSECHRAQCFPFQRRHGKRMSFHPDRAVYKAVQRELQRAAADVAEPPPPADAGPEKAHEDAARARTLRYRAMLQRQRASVSAEPRKAKGRSRSGSGRAKGGRARRTTRP